MLLHYFNDDFTYVIAMYLALFMQNEIICSLIALILELRCLSHRDFWLELAELTVISMVKSAVPGLAPP